MGCRQAEGAGSPEGRGGGSRARLQEISHLFLSEEGGRSEPAREPFLVLPVLLDNPGQAWLVNALAAALMTGPGSTAVIHPGRESAALEGGFSPGACALIGSVDDPQPLVSRLTALLSTCRPAPALALLPFRSSRIAALAHFGRLLLFMEAGREGVVRAYRYIKDLYRHPPGSPAVGVVVVGAGGEEARVAVDLLQGGVSRFLGGGIIPCGHVPPPQVVTDEWGGACLRPGMLQARLFDIADAVVANTLFQSLTPESHSPGG